MFIPLSPLWRPKNGNAKIAECRNGVKYDLHSPPLLVQSSMATTGKAYSRPERHAAFVNPVLLTQKFSLGEFEIPNTRSSIPHCLHRKGLNNWTARYVVGLSFLSKVWKSLLFSASEGERCCDSSSLSRERNFHLHTQIAHGSIIQVFTVLIVFCDGENPLCAEVRSESSYQPRPPRSSLLIQQRTGEIR